MKRLLPYLLLILVFTSFEGAVCGQSLTLESSVKGNAEVNPILPYNLCADPTAVEYNGRLYVYGTNDQQELNTTGDKTNNTYGKIQQLVCMSTADLVNWTYHGIIDVKKVASWIWTSWAPSIVSRVESDGKTHFYLYFTNSASGIGVLTSTSPTGPWKDPLGHALIDGSTPGRGQQSNIIDPGVCIDDEGNGWLAFGGGSPNSSGTKLMPGNARIVKLGQNMISLDSEIVPIPAPFHFEANELNFINGNFVFSYSGGWSCNSSDWGTYSGRGSYACPGNCSILSMQTTDPLNGTWKYTGEMLKNPGSFGYPWGNNHSHLQKFGNSWYMTYHTQGICSKLGLTGGYRAIAISKCAVSESTCRITAPSMNNAGPSIIKANAPKANVVNEAEMIANCAGVDVKSITGANGTAVTCTSAGGWTMVRGLTFPEEAKSVMLRLKGKCKVEIRPGSITASPIATIESTSASLMRSYKVDLTSAIPEGKTYNYFFFVFTEVSGTAIFDRYQFNSLTVDEQTTVSAPEDAEWGQATTSYITLRGEVVERPAHGFYIVKQTLPDGRQRIRKRLVK